MTSRRRFIQGMGAASLSPLASSFAQDDDSVTISILHTTDLHGHITPTHSYPDDDGNVIEDLGGLARCVTQIRAWQKENPNHLLLDIGDLYQGTHVSWSTRGQLMMRLLNSMNYDAWVIGNHEFDWGLQVLVDVVKTATVPVLGANCRLGETWLNRLEASHPLSKTKPYIVKEVAGFKIGVIGTVTPGLPYWLSPDLLGEFKALDPVKSIDFAMRKLREEKVDAIVLATHMGLKGKGRPDDFANRINQVADECVGLDVIIAGHTHRDLPNEEVRGVPYTQANYFGLNCGKVDLVFSKTSRKLIAVNASTKLMDKSIEQDGMILAASAKEREGSEQELAKEIGEISEVLSKTAPKGQASEALRLITRAMKFSLAKRQMPVDGVLHGSFYEFDIKAGKKTLADLWEIVPYENYIATVSLTKEELLVALDETINAPRSTHSLDGFNVTTEVEGKKLKILDVTQADGKPLEAGKRYRIALNSFDAQSGGKRYEELARIVRTKDADMKTAPIQTRESLIEFLTEKKTLKKADLA